MEQNIKPARHVLNLLLLLLTLTFISSCKPEGEMIPPSSPIGEIVDEQEYLNSPYIDQITTIAANSTCATYSWQGRGKAPVGYIKGMALNFARSLCRLKTSEAKPSSLATLLSKNAGSATTDALAHFASTFSNLSLDINSSGDGPLRSLYTLGIGLGMRESSGKYCEGWDKAAGSNRPSAAGEAGLFQTSLDSMSASAELARLYAEYQASPGKCLLTVYRQGASCSSNSNLGTGAGAEFQSFTKSCPAFATEYAMVMLRVRRNHYGPINRKEAEVNLNCNRMLEDVQDLISNDAYVCEDLL